MRVVFHNRVCTYRKSGPAPEATQAVRISRVLVVGRLLAHDENFGGQPRPHQNPIRNPPLSVPFWNKIDWKYNGNRWQSIWYLMQSRSLRVLDFVSNHVGSIGFERICWVDRVREDVKQKNNLKLWAVWIGNCAEVSIWSSLEDIDRPWKLTKNSLDRSQSFPNVFYCFLCSLGFDVLEFQIR